MRQGLAENFFVAGDLQSANHGNQTRCGDSSSQTPSQSRKASTRATPFEE
jgi:hypothetical protein